MITLKPMFELTSMEAIGFDLAWYPFDTQRFEDRYWKTMITGIEHYTPD